MSYTLKEQETLILGIPLAGLCATVATVLFITLLSVILGNATVANTVTQPGTGPAFPVRLTVSDRLVEEPATTTAITDVSALATVEEQTLETVEPVVETEEYTVSEPVYFTEAEPETYPALETEVTNEAAYVEEIGSEEFVVTEEATYAESINESDATYTTSDFMSLGVIWQNNWRYTWYSSNTHPHYRLNEWICGNDLLWRDADGYIVVASVDLPFDAIVDTPFGQGRVYDCGYASGTIDIYTAF